MHPLSAPLKVSVDLTRQCNLACAHCRCRGTDTGDEMSATELAELIKTLGEMRVFRLTFSGGEPLMREDASEILGHAIGAFPGVVSLATNGTLLDARLLGRLRDARDRFAFKVSLDGPPEIHDPFRGRPGLHDVAVDAMRLAVSEGFAVDVTTTLTSLNADRLHDIGETVARCGCRGWNVVEVIPVGAAGPGLLPSRQQVGEADARLAAMRPTLESRGVTVKWRFPFSDGRTPACLGGITECGVLADGTVVGCRLLPHIAEGDVRDRSLAEIWEDARSFSAFRDPVIPACCETCGKVGSCSGGCKAYSWAAGGSSRDPRCGGPMRLDATKWMEEMRRGA